MRKAIYNKKIKFKCDTQQTPVFILAEQCTMSRLIKQTNLNEIFNFYLPEQLHNVINMSPFTEHINDVTDKKTSFENMPVCTDTCGGKTLVG